MHTPGQPQPTASTTPGHHLGIAGTYGGLYPVGDAEGRLDTIGVIGINVDTLIPVNIDVVIHTVKQQSAIHEIRIAEDRAVPAIAGDVIGIAVQGPVPHQGCRGTAGHT